MTVATSSFRKLFASETGKQILSVICDDLGGIEDHYVMSTERIFCSQSV